MSVTALEDARSLLRRVGYDDNVILTEYPVWLGPQRGIHRPDLVAFGRTSPLDMSTAGVTMTVGRVEAAFTFAQALAAPYFLVSDDRELNLWIADADRPVKWRTGVRPDDAAELAEWLQPSSVLTAKLGLRQLPLFHLPVNILAAAKARNADRLSPLVAEALAEATDALERERPATGREGSRLRHRRAARLVVGALTTLVMRDRAGVPFETTEGLISYVARRNRSTYAWLETADTRERRVLEELVERLGEGIDYRSLDPAILSQVYEEALVSDDDRRRLGIHYTPPRLAARLLSELPVELVPPAERYVLDPACGSGSLLVAAHDRLRDLQPPNWTDDERHRDLAVRLRGFDIDSFAVWIARLTLLLHARPAGNGWRVEERDTLRSSFTGAPPNIIATNPPWKYESSGGERVQAADAFVRWSLRTLAPGGVLGVLLPQSWLTANHSATLREDVLRDLDVFEVWRLPEGTFETSTMATAALLARKRDGLGGKGARLIREVHRPQLSAFLEGEPASAQYLLRSPVAALSESVSLPPIKARTAVLDEVADIRSGPQPRPGIAPRAIGRPFLRHFGDVAPYGRVDRSVLWTVAFPQDFQGGSSRGALIVDKKKVLVSAARNPSNPWQLRVAVDDVGVIVPNSVRGVAPKRQDDDDLLYALCLVLGSGFAATFCATLGGARNISAGVLRSMPVPATPRVLRQLAAYGRRASELAGSGAALHDLLAEAEDAVWDAYGIPESDRAALTARLRGHDAPEGHPRYEHVNRLRPPAGSTLRRIGAVLAVGDDGLHVWVSGVTDEQGTTIPLPLRMPGWLARPGATFDVSGVDDVDDLMAGRYRLQPMAWSDLDFEAEGPAPLQRT